MNQASRSSHLKSESTRRKIELGIVFIVIYAALSLYLMSPSVKKYIFHCRPDRGPVSRRQLAATTEKAIGSDSNIRFESPTDG